jgi:chitinase
VPSCNGLVNTFTNAGVPLNKIGIGIAFFGYLWSGGAGTSTGGATQPRQSWTTEPSTSTASFNAIMSSYYQSNLYAWDTNAEAAYLSIDNSASANDKFISYDDEHTCQAKVSFARNRGLGGVMIWELGQGYRASQPSGKRDPLLQAIKQALATPQISSITVSNKNLVFTFTTAPLGSYHVQWTTNLNSSTWTTLTTNSSENGGVIRVIDTNLLTQPRRFYRIRTP